MIERIISIRSLGRFVNYQVHGDVTMRKLTLVYGENGHGKTTLCAMFRSLMTGNTLPLQARQTLGQANQPATEILVNGQVHRLRNGDWTTTLPELSIFDSDFVHQNIYSGDHIELDHRRNSYRVIIGEEGVRLAQEIDQLDADIRNSSANIRQLQGQVRRHIEGNVSVEDFLQISQITDVDFQIQTKEAEIQAIERRTQQIDQINIKGQLQTLTLPTLPTDIEEILAKTIIDVSAEAENRVKGHIQQHLDESGEMWLESGTRYASGRDCPFCGQDLTNSETISLYRSYFNEAYQQLKRDVSTLPDPIIMAGRANLIVEMARIVATNSELMAFWGQFTELILPEVPTEQLQEVIINATNALNISIAAKQQSLLEIVPMPNQWQTFLCEIDLGRQAIAAYNQQVQEINTIIQELKQPQRQDDGSNARNDLNLLRLSKKRYEPSAIVDCTSLTNEMTRKQELENRKVSTKIQLDQFCQSMLQAHQDDINRYLTQFNTNFRITNTRHNYIGGTPSSQFQIVISNEAIELGDERTPDNVPCFKTALSAGDRSALALAFFLTTIRRDPNLANRVVIFDDPFSSQDRFRRAATQYIIARLAEVCNQVIVLSHDPHFLDALQHETHADGIARLQIVALGGQVEISTCDLNQIIGCPLAADRTKLATYVSSGEGVLIDVARAIRPVLEGHLRQVAQGSFNGMHMLGEMIFTIRAASPGDSLYRLTEHLEELEQINIYARDFHHPTGFNVPTPRIDGEELRGFARRTLRLVGGE